MHYLRILLGHLIVPLILAVHAQADYIIDDSNNTIQYFGFWSRIPESNAIQINSSKLYDNTVNHASCSTQDNCYVVIPFAGTGIQVYGVIRADLNLSFTVDGISLAPFVYSTTSCFTPGSATAQDQGCYNASLFNFQNTISASHSLNIYIYTYAGPNPVQSGGNSDFFLDYAVISSPTSGIPSPSTQLSHEPLAAAIGGAAGGLAAVLAVVFAVFYCRTRRKQSGGNEVGSIDPSSQPTPHTTHLPTGPDSLHHWSPTALLSGQINDTSRSHTHVVPTSASATAKIPPSSDGGPVAATRLTSHNSSSSQSTQAAASEASALASSHSRPLPTGTILSRLTEEQSGIVQGLMRNNVPLPTVVGAIEGMLIAEQQPSGNRLTQGDEAPPGYNSGDIQRTPEATGPQCVSGSGRRLQP